MAGKRRDSHTITVAERRAKVLALRKVGATHRAIALELGVDHSTIVRDVQAIFADLVVEQRAGGEELRALELARLDDLALAAARILQASHPLISGGKVLSGFTQDGKAIGLTDDGPRLAAIDRLIRISESRRKLLGLDAAPKAPLNPDGTPAAYAELRAIVLAVLPPEQRLLLADALDEVIDGATTEGLTAEP